MPKDNVILKYFILPLFDIVVNSVKPFFLEAYVNREGNRLFLMLEHDHDFTSIETFDGVFSLQGRDFYTFSLDRQFYKDMKLLLNGQYSKMSEISKEKIRKLSGLNYNVYNPKTNRNSTAAPLLALEKHPKYREKLEKDLKMRPGEYDPDWELFDKATSGIFIENLINNEEL